MKIGSIVKTNKEYSLKIYEPLYHEKFTGIVKSIDKNDVVRVEILKSSCNFKGRYDYHKDKWKKYQTCYIGKSWLDLVE